MGTLNQTARRSSLVRLGLFVTFSVPVGHAAVRADDAKRTPELVKHQVFPSSRDAKADVGEGGRSKGAVETSFVCSDTLGWSVEGRPIECRVFGEGDDVILFIASIHGSERMGTPLLRRLADHLVAHPELLRTRRVVLIPIANPDGFRRRKRQNAHHVDINRNFPAENHRSSHRYGKSPLSEPESTAIYDAINRFAPSRIISIHQPAACIDYDGPGRDVAQAMADASRLKIRRLGGKPGSLGSYAGNGLGIAVITLELPGGLGRLGDDKLWRRFGPMLLCAILCDG